MSESVSNETLEWLQGLSDAGDRAPWKAFVEGRDHRGGSSFIMVGVGPEWGEDLHLGGKRLNDAACADLIAAARTYLPLLIADLRNLRTGSGEPTVSPWVLEQLQMLSETGDAAPWTALDGFIRVDDGERFEKISVDRGPASADAELLELIAAARTYLPLLVAELKALHNSVVELRVVDDWIRANLAWFVGLDVRVDRSEWTSKPAVSLQLNSAERMAQFTLWTSGEAELDRAERGEQLPPQRLEIRTAEDAWLELTKILEFVHGAAR